MDTLKGITTMHTPNPTSQNGAALITGLIFLVVLTLISLSAIKSTSLEERMAGNARDQDVAFQAAEAGIREGVKYISNNIASFQATGFSGFTAGCTAGLCLNNPVTPVWTTITTNNDWETTKTKAYSGLTQVSAQPRYIIELIPYSLPPPGSPLTIGKGNTGAQLTPFRITARGWGVTKQAQTTVQAAINY